jgi:hypothetical protein
MRFEVDTSLYQLDALCASIFLCSTLFLALGPNKLGPSLKDVPLYTSKLR